MTLYTWDKTQHKTKLNSNERKMDKMLAMILIKKKIFYKEKKIWQAKQMCT